MNGSDHVILFTNRPFWEMRFYTNHDAENAYKSMEKGWGNDGKNYTVESGK